MKEQQINAIKEKHKDEVIRESGMSGNSSNSAIEQRILSSAASSSKSYMSVDGEPQHFDMTIDDTMESVEQDINSALDAQTENEEAKQQNIMHMLQKHLGQEVLSDSTVQFAHRMAVEQPDSTVSPPGLTRKAAKAAVGVVVNKMLDAQLAGASIPVQVAGQVAKTVVGGIVNKMTSGSASSSGLIRLGPTPVTDPETQHTPKGPRGRPRKTQLEPSGPEYMIVGNEQSQIRRPAEDSGNVAKKKSKPTKKEIKRQEELEAIASGHEGSAEGGAAEGTKTQPVPTTKMEASGLGDSGKLETKTTTKHDPQKTRSEPSKGKGSGIKSEKIESKTTAKPGQPKTRSEPSKGSGIKQDPSAKPDPETQHEPKPKPGRPKGSSKGSSSKGSAPDSTPGVQRTSLKPPAQTPAQPMIPPSKIGIQVLLHTFQEAKNKNKLSVKTISEYMTLYDEWTEAKGNKQLKKSKLDALRALYKDVLYKK